MYDVYMYVNMYMKILANLSNFCTVSISRQPHHHINVFLMMSVLDCTHYAVAVFSVTVKPVTNRIIALASTADRIFIAFVL